VGNAQDDPAWPGKAGQTAVGDPMYLAPKRLGSHHNKEQPHDERIKQPMGRVQEVAQDTELHQGETLRLAQNPGAGVDAEWQGAARQSDEPQERENHC